MRSYILVLTVAAALTVFATSLASWMLDPYGVGHPLAGEVLAQPNDRASKMAFLADNCPRFDAYIVGNSRTQILSAGDLGGGRYYNLGVPLDDIAQTLERLRFLFSIGCRASALVVGESVDFLPQVNPDSLQYAEHPLISGASLPAFYARYFLGPQGALAYFRSQLVPTSRPMFYHPDGHMDSLWEMGSSAEYALPICRVAPLSADDKERLFGRIARYRDLAALAAQHGTKVIVWLTPLTKTRRAALEDADVQRYIEELGKIPGIRVFDADRDSPLLADFRQWHDCSHFHRTVFDQLVAPGVIRLLHE